MTASDAAIRVAGNHRVHLPGDIRLMTPYVLREREAWFEEEIRFLPFFLRPGMRVVDVGANYGLYTLTLATGVGDAGRVWAFEPASRTFSYLERTLGEAGLSQVTAIRAGLSDREGEARFHLSLNSELNSLQPIVGSSGGGDETVTLRTLDACAAEWDWGEIDFVKLDAEGEEEAIVRGGGRVFAAGSPLVMVELLHGERVNQGLLDELSRLGYGSYRLIPGLNLLVPYAPADAGEAPLNLFCAKPERAEALESAGLLARSMTVPPVDDEAWRAFLEPMPFARPLAGHWAGAGSGRSGRGEHLRALNLYGYAQDRAMPPGARFGALQEAFRLLQELNGGDATGGRLMSFARVALALGARKGAMEGLTFLVNNVGTLGLNIDPGEPFLPAAPRFESVDAGEEKGAWFLAGALEAFVAEHGYSTYATGEQTLSLLEKIRQLGFMGPAMARRRQLILMRAGKQAGPEPEPVLVEEGPDNLNSDYWRGDS